MDTEKRIDLYNELTKLDNEENETNFLESIEYKLKYGNILLDNLIEFENNNIKFEILEGYIDKSFCIIPLFNTFECCTIKLLDEADIQKIEGLIKNIIIKKHKTKKNVIYLFVSKEENND